MIKHTTFQQFNAIYRGIVTDNFDPERKGRCKIFVYGVYPEEFIKTPEKLPWAEPVMPLFGGNWKNDRPPSKFDLNKECGFCTIPHTSEIDNDDGAQVWVFFEGGDPNFPKYFAACQSGSGWLSEHRYQHVMKTPNTTIIIDENPYDSNSSQKFDSNTSKGLPESKYNHSKSQVPTRVDVRIRNKPGIALNIHIEGDVNLKVDGNIYEEVTGDKHIYQKGNIYEKLDGDIHRVVTGNVVEEIRKNKIDIVGKDRHITTKGNMDENTIKNKTEIVFKNKTENIKGFLERFIIKDISEHVLGNKNIIVDKDFTINTIKEFGVNCEKSFLNSFIDMAISSQTGKVTVTSMANQIIISGIETNIYGAIIELEAGAIFNNSGGPYMDSTQPSPLSFGG